MSADSSARMVVTGATGFIGTHLVSRLRREGLPILAVVRAAPTHEPLPQGVEYVVRDLERVGTIADVLRAGDIVVHLAARVHVMHDSHATTPAAYEAANVEPMRMICRSASECGVRRVVYLSSAKVFGEGREQPYTREDPVAPADAYAKSKAAAERVLRDAGNAADFEWTILRPPFVYGEGGKGNFPRLVSLARLSSIVPLPLGSIENLRSIVYVGNLVDLIVHASLHPRGNRQVLLPTDAKDVSTPELIRAIGAATNSAARLFPFPQSALRLGAGLLGRSAEMDRLTESLRLDSHHLREELGWQPPFTLDGALARSVKAEGSASVRRNDV